MITPITIESTETVCKSQAVHLGKWVTEFVTINRDTLKTQGITASVIYENYKKSTPFPVGAKAFFPALHLCGCEKIRRMNAITYILNV